LAFHLKNLSLDYNFETCHILRKFLQNNSLLKVPCIYVRTSQPVLSMWLPTVKFIVKKSKCVGLAQEIGLSAPTSCSLLWLVKGATQLCTSKKECNILDMTLGQYFWLVNHNDWSRWFAISSSHVYAVPGTVLMVSLPKKKTAKLRHLILLSRVTYWAPGPAKIFLLSKFS
jgi:hypothetical protein